MKLFRRPKKPSTPERRNVPGLGRTTAYAYHANRFDEQAALGRHVFREALERRVKHKERRQLWRRLVGGFMMLLVLAGGVYMLGLSTDPVVLPVDNTQAAMLHPMADYQRAAMAAMNASFLNHNKITVNTHAISDTLRKQFPELEIVSVNLPVFGQRPTIYIAPADPVLALTTRDSHTFVIDSMGRAIGNISADAAAKLHLTPTQDMSGASIQSGQPVLATNSMTFIQTLLYQLHQKHLVISKLVLPEASSEIDLYLVGQPYYGKFNLANDTALQQVGTYLAAKHYLEGKGVTPQEYIDVRVDGRAYYK